MQEKSPGCCGEDLAMGRNEHTGRKDHGANAEQYTVLLTGEGQLHARVDCNRGGGT